MKYSKNKLSKNSKNKLSKNSKNKLSKKSNTKQTTKSYKKRFLGGAAPNTTAMVGEEAQSSFDTIIDNYEKKVNDFISLWKEYSGIGSKYSDIEWELSEEHYNLIFFGDQIEHRTTQTIEALAASKRGLHYDIRTEFGIGTKETHPMRLHGRVFAKIGEIFAKNVDLGTHSGAWSALYYEQNTMLNSRNAASYSLDTTTPGGKVFYRIVWLMQIWQNFGPGTTHGQKSSFLLNLSKIAHKILSNEIMEYCEAMLEPWDDKSNPVITGSMNRLDNALQVKKLHDTLWNILGTIGEERYQNIADAKGTIWDFLKNAGGMIKMGVNELSSLQ